MCLCVCACSLLRVPFSGDLNGTKRKTTFFCGPVFLFPYPGVQGDFSTGASCKVSNASFNSQTCLIVNVWYNHVPSSRVCVVLRAPKFRLV